MLLIHHEGKAPVIKEVITAFVPLKDMRDGHLLMDRIAAPGQPDILQRMIQECVTIDLLFAVKMI